MWLKWLGPAAVNAVSPGRTGSAFPMSSFSVFIRSHILFPIGKENLYTHLKTHTVA